MGKSLIIVESPTKIKTLKKFLDGKYLIESSVGHIRDLPKKGLGIDMENDYEPQYEELAEKKEVIQKLKKAAKECDTVYLAPDPDREGEAIAWHIMELLPDKKKCQRITFNEITKSAVVAALEEPRSLHQSLVDAQQARRILDRIVGYKLSPILYRKVKSARDGGLSAGRVQSVALKLVVDREKEIDAFKPIEYWQLSSTLSKGDQQSQFEANLYSVDGLKVEKELIEKKAVCTIENKEKADQVLERLKKASYRVGRVEKKEKKRNPVPPFITSSMQQEASRHHGFGASRTMSVAQSLYEGVDLGPGGSEGLITYMRTDSVRVAAEAEKEAAKFIQKTWGKEYLPPSPPKYATKKNAQDAHEAIRPTNFANAPDRIRNYLTSDQFKLYDLIWKRFFASQMRAAIYDTVSAEIHTDQDLLLKATGSTIKFLGFLIAYEEKTDDEKPRKEGDRRLPNLEEGEMLNLVEALANQSFTKPPARFTEASLIKELERLGIGRPSTYTSIMQKIQSRDYTEKEKSALKPTELGKIVVQLLETSFPNIMDAKFTAHLEDDLDLIAEEKVEWKGFIKEFCAAFLPQVEVAEKEAHVPKETTDLPCPKCGHPLQKIWARNKYFYGCSNYPDCDYTAPLEEIVINKEEYADDFNWDQTCDKCGSAMSVRQSRFGLFLGCSAYPKCRNIVNIPRKGELKQEDLPDCPAIGCPGKITAKRSRFGKTFYSCNTFPECDVIVNDIDDLATKYANHPRTASQSRSAKKAKAKTAAKGKATKAKTTKAKPKKASTRKQPTYKLSPELKAICEVEELSRGDVTKKIWAYIKENNLQDEKNKRLIVPDAKLAAVFGSKEAIDMMQIAKKISPHLSKE